MTVIEITADQLQPGDTIITARGMGLDVLRRRITDVVTTGTVSARCQGPDGKANSVVLPGQRTVIVDRPQGLPDLTDKAAAPASTRDDGDTTHEECS